MSAKDEKSVEKKDITEKSAPKRRISGPVPFKKNIVINPEKRLPQYDNGTALAYDAYDERIKTKKYVALLAGVEDLSRWTSANVYNSLTEMAFLRTLGHGVVDWPVDNTQKYAYVYDAKFGDVVVPTGGLSHITWRHPDIVERFIHPIARALRDMSERSFNHGAIRADNIYHGSVNKDKPVILGDCLAVQPSASQPSVYLPIDKALADPMGRGEGSLADDIYAFGVSLLFFLRKNDETSALSDEEIVRRKIELGSYAALIGGERFQASFLELLRGVLHDDVSQRWKLDDIFSWLDGARLTPPTNTKRKKAQRPLIFNGQKYLFPDVLALDLVHQPNDIVAMVEDGLWRGGLINLLMTMRFKISTSV